LVDLDIAFILPIAGVGEEEAALVVKHFIATVTKMAVMIVDTGMEMGTISPKAKLFL
jgi:hypothetical protein